MPSLKAIAIAALYLVTFSGISLPPIPLPSTALPPHVRTPVSLGVPLVFQHASEWCWAASSEMCMNYYHDSIDPHAPDFSQCELARDWFKFCNRYDTEMLKDVPNLRCDLDSVKHEFDIPGQPYFWPDTPEVGRYYYYGNSIPVLNWDALCDTVGARKPIIFNWQSTDVHDSEDQSHDMVAEGCTQTTDMPQYRWVSIIDPWPVMDSSGSPMARHSQLAYSDYKQTTRASVIWKRQFVWAVRGPDCIVSKVPKAQR